MGAVNRFLGSERKKPPQEHKVSSEGLNTVYFPLPTLIFGQCAGITMHKLGTVVRDGAKRCRRIRTSRLP